MSQGAHFEVDHHEALEQVVIKHQIHVEVFVLESHSLLSGDEGEALAKFQEEGLEIVDDGLFNGGFSQRRVVFQVEKLEHVRVADELLGRDLGQLGRSLFANGRLLAARQQAFFKRFLGLSAWSRNCVTSALFACMTR